jgi:preprotein translocase subunit SecF
VSVLSDLYHGRNNFDFARAWRISLPAAAIATLLALVLLFTRGLDLSIDFEGGGVWEVPVDQSVTVADARAELAVVDLSDARIQLVQDPNGRSFLRVQAGTEALDRQSEITTVMAELGDTTLDEVAVNTVGPTWGDEITRQAIRALVYFAVAVSLYLAWRLEWRMAVGALASVVHDVAVTAAVYSLFGFDVSPATVIALLTILGYSLYDTVVVYDKIKENQANAAVAGQLTYQELVIRSTNQVTMRSINTTITTLLPVGSMLFVGSLLLGGATLVDFSLALFIGLFVGAYSSIFIAAPIVVALHGRDLRAGLRRTEAAPPARRERATVPSGEAPTRSPVAPGGSVPRPRKRRRR